MKMSSDERSAQRPGRFHRSVSLLCWAYNEEVLVEDFLRRITALLADTVEEFEIVFVDDGSTDRTTDIVRSLQEEIPQIRLVVHEVNLNVGHACRRAIQEARCEVLFWQTIDWSYDIHRLRCFLELLNDYDVVAGVRPRAAGQKLLTERSDTPAKGLVSIANYLLVRLLFGVPLSDFQNVCFYPTKMLQSISLEGYSSFVNPEALIRAYAKGSSIVEVPIPFLPRQAGEAKGTRPAAVARSIRDIFRAWITWGLMGRIRRGPQRGSVRALVPDEWQ